MKKTFRKAIAVLLAVLMLAFSVPFSALAGTPDAPDMFGETNYTVTKNRKWWVDDGVDTSLSKLQSTPEYWSYNSDETYNQMGSWSLSFGGRFEDYGNSGYEDHRNDYKPVIAATVSSQGTNAGMKEAIAKVKDKSDTNAIKNYAASYFQNYYGMDASHTYEAVKTAKNILNPATLKAGDRIAVTVEFGGFDVLQNGQFKGKFNKEYLKAAAYSSKPSRGDTWKAVSSGAAGCIADGTQFYPTALAFAGNNVNVEDGTFYGAVIGKAAVAGDQSVSNFIGTADGVKPFGKYGIVSFVYSFEVLQDCDLSDVFTFNTDIAGTEFEPYYRTSLDGTGEPNNTNAVNPELFLITHDDTDSTFANWALIWTDYAKESTPETKTYTITFNDINGKTVDTQTVKEGETPTVPSTNTAAAVNYKSDNKHEVTTYSWPAVSAATADTTYTEVATTAEENCNITYAETSKHTLVSGTVLTGTCTVCNHVDTQTKDDKLDGTAYYAALDAAKAVDGTKYTAESYAKVTAALETYAQAKVEAYTDQAQVTAAATALENAVNGLEALPTSDVYTYTFAGGKTQTVTADKGAAPIAPANTAATTVDNNDGTHTVTSYTWEKTGEFTFAEKANADTKDCTYGEYTTVTASTIAKAGTEKATCSVCGHEDVRDLAKLDGTAYYAALAKAEAVKADDYTAESYAKVTAALEANAKATVEAYTDQAQVTAAATALEDAVKGLVKVYTITFTNAAGTVVDTQKLAAGATPVAPKTNTAAAVNYKSDNKHEVTTYSWPAVSAATADTTYTEVATTAEENCNITYAETSKHTLVSGTVLTGTCTVCNHVDTQTKDDKLDGTAYYAALDAAKAVDGTKYTAESYAKVTAALETYAQAKVEAYTDQAQVTAAATALENAVNGLEALPTSDVYTYTFAGGKTQTVTADKGAAPIAPANTAATTVDNNDGTHTVTSYTWEKTGEFTFAEKANADTKDCTYGEYTTVTASTIAKAGTEKATCSVCGHEDVRDLAKLDGTAYYAALAKAEAVKADDYTAESYAKVTAALEANAKATVEAYTDQAQVTAAATALEDAVKGLVKVYTITFTNAAGTVVDTQKLAAGATPVAPKTNTADTTATPAGSKQHSHTTYSWPAVSAVTANANYDEVAKVVTEDCTKGKPVVTEPTLDKPGSEVTSCTICGQVLETKVLPQLKGYDITVAKTAYGTTTLNSEDATNGKTTKVPANSTVTLTAQANEGAEFVGWKVANKLVSTNETYSFTAVADTEVTPVFTETAESTFVVVFIDMYGNVVSTQEVASGADIKVPATAPIYPGYTFKGWALTNDEITALTEGKTIRAIYEKDATQTYTVKAAGATITVNGTDYTDKAENVAYDAKVTVTKAGATSWTVNGATVGYGESYSFFCASDIELTAVTKADDTSKTQVAIVSTTRPSATDCDVLFVATRTVADNETVVSQGFVYGKNVTASDLTLENVGKTASGTNPGKVRVIYNNTNASQIGLNYGLTAKTGVAGARAFVVTKDADGNVHTYYSEASLYDYNA